MRPTASAVQFLNHKAKKINSLADEGSSNDELSGPATAYRACAILFRINHQNSSILMVYAHTPTLRLPGFPIV
jgi:hypothetical protein